LTSFFVNFVLKKIPAIKLIRITKWGGGGNIYILWGKETNILCGLGASDVCLARFSVVA
jgi:hypothetical protein